MFQKLGLQKGQCIHIMTGNHNYSYLANFAAWHLGAFTSTGDVALDEDTIAGQVLVNLLVSFNIYFTTFLLASIQ